MTKKEDRADGGSCGPSVSCSCPPECCKLHRESLNEQSFLSFLFLFPCELFCADCCMRSIGLSVCLRFIRLCYFLADLHFTSCLLLLCPSSCLSFFLHFLFGVCNVSVEYGSLSLFRQAIRVLLNGSRSSLSTYATVSSDQFFFFFSLSPTPRVWCPGCATQMRPCSSSLCCVALSCRVCVVVSVWKVASVRLSPSGAVLGDRSVARRNSIHSFSCTNTGNGRGKEESDGREMHPAMHSLKRSWA
mmetsp:Transcript_29872/g.58607  ORF Transcript_29872/g.58607 Transcript_29872/m.58607 type:complete len:245 (-) Transcript_29872:130-864(-)